MSGHRSLSFFLLNMLQMLLFPCVLFIYSFLHVVIWWPCWFVMFGLSFLWNVCQKGAKYWPNLNKFLNTYLKTTDQLLRPYCFICCIVCAINSILELTREKRCFVTISWRLKIRNGRTDNRLWASSFIHQTGNRRSLSSVLEDFQLINEIQKRVRPNVTDGDKWGETDSDVMKRKCWCGRQRGKEQ